jgi:hypothetical protein
VFSPVDQDFGMTSQHDPTELSPIFLITIDNNAAARNARSHLPAELREASARLPRVDVHWLVSEDHIKKALARPIQKSTSQTP